SKLLNSNKINDYNNGENIKSCIIGDNKNILIHKNARIYPGVYFLCDNGRIVIDSNANIKPLSIIDGSCYIGKNALIETAKVGGGTSIFDFCKIGGEVENSIVLEMSNKHHEGFLGHSYVGSYVNLGALSCTSDLKNNYGDVTVTLKGKKVNTKSLKLGAFIGDHTKLGIGSLINTGSVIGLGCNLYSEGGMYPKEIPSFLWGGKIPFKEYIFDKFIENCKKVLKRRNKILNNEEIKLFKKIYQCEQETRNYFKISS
ncbi:MAG: hypothetical protein OEV44_14985, partial [Spirochaetota bacterium]|nr:hypothetical protein [Spirochaetota bacterium]